MKLSAALLLALAAAAPALAQNCISNNVKVSDSGAKSAQPINYTTAFDLDGADQHFQSLLPVDDFRWNTKSTFSCVDSRGEQNELGTPGGDIAELAGAIAVFFNQTGQNVTDAAVDELFKYMVPKIASKDRPFYYHTSDEKLVKIFHYLEEHFVESGAIKKRPTVFPERMPTNKAAADAWFEALSMGKHQGCGHMRLMIDQFADYGLDSDAVPKALIKAFFNYWWPTAPKSEERARMKLVVVQGPLSGNAVAIVTSDGCPGRSPAVPPSHDGSQLFVYHAQAVDDFRKLAITPVMVEYAKSKGLKLDPTAYYNTLKDLQGKMLGAVLTYLAPANALPIYNVMVKAEVTQATPQNTNDDKPAPGRDLSNTKNVASNYDNVPGANVAPAKAPAPAPAPAKAPAPTPAKAPAPAPKAVPHNNKAPHNNKSG